jgi:hypothetical protein
MPFRRQAFDDEPGAKQNGELAILIDYMTSEKPRQIEKRHGTEINRLTEPQSLKRVPSVAFTARDGPDTQDANAREGERCRRREPDMPEHLAIVCRLLTFAAKFQAAPAEFAARGIEPRFGGTPNSICDGEFIGQEGACEPAEPFFAQDFLNTADARTLAGQSCEELYVAARQEGGLRGVAGADRDRRIPASLRDVRLGVQALQGGRLHFLAVFRGGHLVKDSHTAEPIECRGRHEGELIRTANEDGPVCAGQIREH